MKVYYNERYNSIWLCIKNHGHAPLSRMYLFVKQKGRNIDTTFINPAFITEQGFIEICDL